MDSTDKCRLGKTNTLTQMRIIIICSTENCKAERQYRGAELPHQRFVCTRKQTGRKENAAEKLHAVQFSETVGGMLSEQHRAECLGRNLDKIANPDAFNIIVGRDHFHDVLTKEKRHHVDHVLPTHGEDLGP